MRKKQLLTLAAAAASLPALMGAAAVQDDGSSSNPEVDAALTEIGVSADTRVELIADLEAGELWDSLSGAEPVSIETTEVDGFTYETAIYADGSRNQTVAQVPSVQDGDISLRAPEVCTIPNGPYPQGYSFTNCRIATNNGLISMSYYIDGRTRGATVGYLATITNAVNFDYQIFGGTHVSDSLTTVRASETSGAPAQARGVVTIDYPAQGGVVTLSLYANVSWGITATES